MRFPRLKGQKASDRYPRSRHRSMRITIAVSFSLIAIVIMILMSVILYKQFENSSTAAAEENADSVLNQTKLSFEDYLRSMRRVSDAMYYSAIKGTDFTDGVLTDEFNLMYEAEKDNVISIALYAQDGRLLNAVPVSSEKSGVDVTEQAWFTGALNMVENINFSSPHVQNLFDESTGQYHWVISVSRAVEIDYSGVTELGVLLVDMDFGSIRQMIEKANNGSNAGYIYLCDSDGNIIYHPKQSLIDAGLYSEDNMTISGRFDGSYTEDGNITVIKSVSYTGWKLVYVIPSENIGIGAGGFRYLIVLIISLAIIGILLVNRLVSIRIASPLEKLDKSVKKLEAGNLNADIYIGGSSEVEHLGRRLQSSVYTINKLMSDMVIEQEEKRRSELDALQSQINPHFLYNTLDSAIWMIEDERYDGAVRMIKELARLMRISISHGRAIIPIRDEIAHAESYMNIQLIRYKESFAIDFKVDEDILDCSTVKLVIQPLLENAIYYGVQALQGEGQISVHAYRSGDDICIDVTDNGVGMEPGKADDVLSEKAIVRHRSSRHGNGVGLYNVHNRIRLRFGEKYGLKIISEPDEGTTVQIRLPYIPYSDDLESKLNKRDQDKKEGDADA